MPGTCVRCLLLWCNEGAFAGSLPASNQPRQKLPTATKTSKGEATAHLLSAGWFQAGLRINMLNGQPKRLALFMIVYGLFISICTDCGFVPLDFVYRRFAADHL